MLALMSLSGGDNTDNYGHFGGVFFGFLIGMMILRFNRNATFFKMFSLAGWVTLAACVVSYVSMIVIFFTVRKPAQQV